MDFVAVDSQRGWHFAFEVNHYSLSALAQLTFCEINAASFQCKFRQCGRIVRTG